MSYECSDKGTCTPNIRNCSTRSHVSEGEIALEIAAKIASVNRALSLFHTSNSVADFLRLAIVVE
jgi:hypothetical protein